MAQPPPEPVRAVGATEFSRSLHFVGRLTLWTAIVSGAGAALATTHDWREFGIFFATLGTGAYIVLGLAAGIFATGWFLAVLGRFATALARRWGLPRP